MKNSVFVLALMLLVSLTASAQTLEVWYSQLPESLISHGWTKTRLDNPDRDVYQKGPCTVTTSRTSTTVWGDHRLVTKVAISNIQILVVQDSMTQTVMLPPKGKPNYWWTDRSGPLPVVLQTGGPNLLRECGFESPGDWEKVQVAAYNRTSAP